jgi:hypothetical protein
MRQRKFKNYQDRDKEQRQGLVSAPEQNEAENQEQERLTVGFRPSALMQTNGRGTVKLLKAQQQFLVEKAGQVYGNRGVQRLLETARGSVAPGLQRRAEAISSKSTGKVQRDDDATAKAEWKAHPKIHSHFENGLDTYLELRPMYQAKGLTNPAEYLDAHIKPVSFFGHKTPANDVLETPLKTAEATLKNNQVTPAVSSFWAFVPRKTAAGKLSNHAMGRAVDINPGENPHIKSKQDILVIEAVTGVDLGAKQSAEDMREASESFKQDFTKAWIDEQKAELKELGKIPRAKRSAEDKKRIKELQKLTVAIKVRHSVLNSYAKKGFFNLQQELVDALVGAGFSWGGGWKNEKDFMHFEISQ